MNISKHAVIAATRIHAKIGRENPWWCMTFEKIVQLAIENSLAELQSSAPETEPVKCTKIIEWSYPSSPNAERFGFIEGCWTVEINETGKSEQHALMGFKDRAEAIKYATPIPVPWSELMQF